VICWTHHRSCSTALLRAFMTRTDLQCVHEPFGESYYFGRERLAQRYSEKECSESQYKDSTYRKDLDSLLEQNRKCRIFAKDMALYLIPPHGAAAIARSFGEAQEPGNPTVIPLEELRKFKHIFLIRTPLKAIPSYVRCTVPPLSERTGFHYFRQDEAGYRELLMLVRFLQESGIEPSPCVLDAEDLLYDPETCIRGLCNEIQLPYSDSMLSWEKDDGKIFDKWKGFHDDAKDSTGFRKRGQGSVPKTRHSLQDERDKWEKKYSVSQTQQIYNCVKDNLPLYQELHSLLSITPSE